MKDINIEDMNFSARTYNCLKKANILTLSELLHLDKDALFSIRNMGSRSVEEVIETIESYIADPEYGITIDDLKTSPSKEEKILLINEALPETIGQEGWQAYYNNIPVQSVEIKSLMFSVRTYNVLDKHGIDNLEKLCLLKYDDFIAFRSLGTKSISEVMDFLKNNITILSGTSNDKNILKQEKIDSLYKFFVETAEYEDFDCSFVADSVYAAIANNADILFTEENLNLGRFVYSDLFVENVLKSPQVKNILLTFLSNKMQEFKEYTDVSEICCDISDIVLPESLAKELLDELVISGTVESFENKYRLKLMTLDEWIASLKDRPRLIIETRLEGKTLEECGKLIDVTRERARQIIAKALKGKPVLREDEFSYWYEKYNLSDLAMKYLFGVDDRIVNYYDIAFARGLENLESILEDEKITRDIYLGYKEYEHRNSIYIYGEYVPINRAEILKAVIRNETKDHAERVEILWDKYNGLLKDNGLELNEKLLFSTLHAFEARLADVNYAINMLGKQYRYYPLVECDIESFVAELHLEKYVDVEISTKKIIAESSQIVSDYDIRNEYELHNMLNRTQHIWNKDNKYKIQFGKMPFISFGVANRAAQTEWLLYQIAPVSVEEFGQFYESEFGVMAKTAISNMGKYIDKYFHHGFYSVDQVLPSVEQKAYLESILTGDLYFMEDIKKLFVAKFGLYAAECLNARTYKELGYMVLSRYIVKNTYASADEYFNYLFTNENEVDLRGAGERIPKIWSAYKVIDRLKENFDLFEMFDNRYWSLQKFQETFPQFDKDCLKQYAKDALDSVEDIEGDKYFTIQSIRNSGFHHDLDKIGADDCFYSGLIKSNSKVIGLRIGSNNVLLLHSGKNQATLGGFISYILSTFGSMHIDEFIDYVYKHYGIAFIKEKITYMDKGSTVYYSSVTKKIYRDKNCYYEEIFK